VSVTDLMALLAHPPLWLRDEVEMEMEMEMKKEM